MSEPAQPARLLRESIATVALSGTLPDKLASAASTVVIPANYYEDVAAPLGLDDDEMAVLERLGLLYDRDTHGDFCHAYTQPFQDRFFFEVVERRNGYAGFGAANAAVRMAAQARDLLISI